MQFWKSKYFFCPKGQKTLAKGGSPPQELEGLRSGPYFLVFLIIQVCATKICGIQVLGGSLKFNLRFSKGWPYGSLGCILYDLVNHKNYCIIQRDFPI